jgi:hypothetical protein
MRAIAPLALAGLVTLLPTVAPAADVVTDGDMEAAGIGAWPHTDITGTNSSAKATDQSASGQSLKGTSAAGRRTDVGWFNTQTIGVVSNTDTVQLSLWWGIVHTLNVGGAAGTLFFDIKPASGAWTNVWNLIITTSTTFQSGTVTPQDISASFATSESYDIRLRFEGTTGNNPSATVEVWWDDVVVDVTAAGGPDTLITSSPAAVETADPSQGQAGIVMQRFQVDSGNTGNGQVELTSLTLGDLGTATTADIDTVRVYIDTDSTFAGATEIGNAAFASDPVTVSLTLGTAADRTVTNGTPKYVFVVYDLNAGATIGNTIQSQVTDVGVAAPDSGASGLAYTSNSLTIQGPQPDTLTTSSPAAVEAADPSQGQAGIVMQRFQVDSDNTGNGQVELTSLTLQDQGTAVVADIDTVRVYIDTDTAFAGATEIGSAAFGTDPVTVSLTLGTAADRTVTNGTPKYVFVVYDLNAGATVGATIQSRVTDVAVAGPDNGVSSLAYDSNLLTIQAASANGTTVVSNSAVVSSCRQITVTSAFTGDADADGTTLVEISDDGVVFSTACAAVSGPSPRQCLITTGLTEGSNHWVRITFSDPDGVSGTNPETLSSLAVPTCGADAAAPTVLVLAPRRDAVVGGVDRVKVQVFDEDGLAGTNPVQWSVDGGALSAAVVINTNYDCGASCAVYELDLDTTALANGSHVLTIQATDAAGNVAVRSRAFRVGNLAGRARGSGHLLRRTTGSQICIDCHNLPTHSSQTTSTRYGNWAMECFDCHTPHRTRNIYLIREALRTPNSGTATVDFRVNADANYGYLGDRSGANNTPYTDGVCEACHTRTNHHRNDTSGGDHTHNVGSGKACIECHTHENGFSGGGGGCLGCHGNAGDIATTGPNNRRPVNPDFTLQSHHVGDGGTMGGALSDFDCVVCHGEGTVSGGETVTTGVHQDGIINLKNADNVAVLFSYDKSSMPAAAANWNSGDATWRAQTSTNLDPFCLTCHDADGAVGSYNATDGGSALNPFGDALVTNNYDQQDRTRVTDIKSKVFGNPPPQGQFSRHAIRGQSTSIYTSYQNIGGASDFSIYEGDPTAGQSLLTNMGTDELGQPLWNDTSVMGCADCHTVDGANGASGNAHGSGSEYLLKDASGGATEGTLAALSYVCYRCHKSGRYQPPGGPLGDHTGNGNDWQDKTALTGTARRDDGKGSNVFAMACTNCHGGFGFGSIHGTSQVIATGQDGGGPNRNAYRFMNGASLRFYDPNGWTGTSITCYTLSKNTTPDSWGACTQHGGGQGWTKPLQRPLSY